MRRCVIASEHKVGVPLKVVYVLDMEPFGMNIYVIRGNSQNERVVVFREDAVDTVVERALRDGLPVELVFGHGEMLCLEHEELVRAAFAEIDGVRHCESGIGYITVTVTDDADWSRVHEGFRQKVSGILDLELEEVHLHDLCIDS